MVNKLNNLIARIEMEKGEILLFMLWKNLPDDSLWSVIISADWIEQLGHGTALSYWITKIRSALSQNELSSISRISFIKPNDKMVNLIASAIKVTATPVKFSKNQIGDLYIEEAVIFRSRKKFNRSFLGISNRNPIYNHNINPIYNHNINPIYNHNINPIYNHNINPIYNHNINPIYNHSINPIYNPDFPGYYLYDKSLRQISYLIYANDEIILLFNLDNNLQAVGVKNSLNGFTLHDDNRNWLGTLIPNGQNGFVFYSKDNQQIGFAN